MGYTPCQVTYASDHFQKLYEYAVLLIKKGFAFVCHQPSAEIKRCRYPLIHISCCEFRLIVLFVP